MSGKNYPWDSAEYSRYSAAQFGWAQELLARLALKGNETFLDIGSGDGKVTALVSGLLPEGYVVGIDNSQDMLQMARQRFPGTEFKNLDFCRMDAACLAFKSFFDVAFSNATLHWIEDHMSVLQGVARSLKHSGKILFQMGGPGNARQIIDVAQQVIQRADWEPYFQDFPFPFWFYNPTQYRTWVEQAGLQAKRVELLPKDMQHSGRDGLAGWIRTTWLPYTQRVPQHLRERFISEIVSAYLRLRPLDSAGYAHVDMVRLEVEAVKV